MSIDVADFILIPFTGVRDLKRDVGIATAKRGSTYLRGLDIIRVTTLDGIAGCTVVTPDMMYAVPLKAKDVMTTLCQGRLKSRKVSIDE